MVIDVSVMLSAYLHYSWTVILTCERNKSIRIKPPTLTQASDKINYINSYRVHLVKVWVFLVDDLIRNFTKPCRYKSEHTEFMNHPLLYMESYGPMIVCSFCRDHCARFFLLVIVLYVLLQFISSDYSFGIFKLFYSYIYMNSRCKLKSNPLSEVIFC